MQYYHKMEITQLSVIQDELYSYVKDIVESPPKNFFNGKVVPYNELDKFPNLMQYLSSISKLPIHKSSPIKFFMSWPGAKSSIHMDYDTTSRIGLNIPVAGCDNTFLRYYETSIDNVTIENPRSALSQGYSYITKNPDLLQLTDEIEFIKPYLVRTDHFHQSINSSTEVRVIATMRWEANRHLTEFEDFVYI